MEKSTRKRKKAKSTIAPHRRGTLKCGKRFIRKKLPKTGVIFTDSKFPLVKTTAARLGMRSSSGDWTLLWTDTFVSAETCRSMLPHQRVNRFPGVSAFACKDLLAQNLNRLYNAFPDRYKIFPKTWCLPHDYASITAYGIAYPKKTFIIKPARGAEGRGIYITKNLKLIKPQDRMICQVYINKPFLIDGYKFDMRVYALISTINPLRIYVYNEGLTRFATKKYEEPSSSNMNDKFMHLTNYAVNRRSAFYVDDQKAGTKRSISTLNKWFSKKGFSVKLIWASIDDAIVKTVLVALPTLRRYYSECFPNHVATSACFQMLGFDMILDHRLKPYVLEVNHSPSMGTPTSLDAEVKSKLLHDTFRLLNLPKDDREDIANFEQHSKKIRGHGDRPHRLYNNNEPAATDRKMKAQLVRSSMIWEKRHLGNYRKVYPNKNVKRYKSIIEYLNRLKWPTLHRIPVKSESENLVNVHPNKQKRFSKTGEAVRLSETKFESVDVADQELDGNTNSNVQLPEKSKLTRPQVDLNSSSYEKFAFSAFNLNVLGKYNFIDRLACVKVENNKVDNVVETLLYSGEDDEELDSDSVTKPYECAESHEIRASEILHPNQDGKSCR